MSCWYLMRDLIKCRVLSELFRWVKILFSAFLFVHFSLSLPLRFVFLIIFFLRSFVLCLFDVSLSHSQSLCVSWPPRHRQSIAGMNTILIEMIHNILLLIHVETYCSSRKRYQTCVWARKLISIWQEERAAQHLRMVMTKTKKKKMS